MKCQKNKFLLNKKYAYLNCAYMAPLMKKVEKAGKKGVTVKRQPNLIEPDDFFKDIKRLKTLFSKLINNPEVNRIALIPSTSYGISTVVNNIEINAGDNVVICKDQFPSNVYPWKNKCDENDAELILVAPPETLEHRGKKWNENIIDSISEKTKAVSLGHVHWTDGTMFDLKTLRKKCNEVGAALIVDGTQSIGALPFDIQDIKPDALIVSGYKWLLGPYSIGLAYYGSRFDKGKPIEQNYINRINSEKFSELVNYQDEYQEGAHRFEVGEKSNFILNPMLIESLKQINLWGVENIQNYCRSLVEPFIKKVLALGLKVEEDKYRGSHLFGIKIPEEHMPALQKQLKVHRVSVSVRGNYLRVSPNVYNDDRDMNKLYRALKTVF